MRNTLIMQVIECFTDLFEESPTNILLYLPIDTLVLDVLVQRYTRNIISHNANLLVCFDQIMHSNYIWMINLLQCHYFTLHRLSFHAVIELHFLINLYCTFFHTCLMIAYINNCKCALTDSLADLVVFEQACLTGMYT